jgi:CheY-like chemotaxis protein
MAKILIVDDNIDSCNALEKLLQSAGHEITHAHEGRAALAQVINDRPDVVLLDLVMPEMDGAAFLEVVRSYSRLQSLPVVVHTAFGDSPLVDRVRALKVNAILAKGKTRSEDVLRALEAAIVHLPL